MPSGRGSFNKCLQSLPRSRETFSKWLLCRHAEAGKELSPGFRLLTRARRLDLNFQKASMKENSLEKRHELALKKGMKLLGSFKLNTTSGKIEGGEGLLSCGLSDQECPSTSLLSSL